MIGGCPAPNRAAFLRERGGLIIADGYDAEIVRPAASVPLAAARRKVEVERLARTALRRMVTSGDPGAASRGPSAPGWISNPPH